MLDKEKRAACDRVQEEVLDALRDEFQWRIEMPFRYSVVGQPQAVSEYGVPYTTYGLGVVPTGEWPLPLDVDFVRAVFAGPLDLYIDKLIKQGDILVWRRLPELKAYWDSDNGGVQLRFSFRAHAMKDDVSA